MAAGEGKMKMALLVIFIKKHRNEKLARHLTHMT